MYQPQISGEDVFVQNATATLFTSFNSQCTLDTVSYNSNKVAFAVDIFYVAGGIISFFGVALNLLCLYTVRSSTVYSHTCLGFYLQIICFIDSLKLIAEYQLRILIMTLPIDYKIMHCNIRLGAIMITENLSYVYSIVLALDRCGRIWRSNWAKRKIKLQNVKVWVLVVTILVILYCHPHFYPVDHCKLVLYPHGYYTHRIYADCLVLSNKLHAYISFPFYWNHVESWVNSFILPAILVGLNVLLSLGLFYKCRTGSSNSIGCYQNRPRLSHFKLKRKKSLFKATKEASLLVLIDSLLFLVTITPVNAFTYFFRATNTQTMNTKTAYSLIGLTFSLVNHALNGIVFICCSKTFRGELGKVLLGCKVKKESKINGYSSQNSTWRIEKTTAQTSLRRTTANSKSLKVPNDHARVIKTRHKSANN
jgi:hypothetical protein